MWLYSIFAFFDNAIYSMVKFGVRLIMLIANYDFFTEPTIDKIASRIYVVLGVLMLFKIVISAVQYMVNPDTFDDKDKGMGGILKKMVICMALLVLIKPIFNFAMYMQKSIVSTIPGLILNSGQNYKIEDNSAGNALDEIGNKVAGTTIKAFVSLKTDDKRKGKTDQITDDLDSFNEHIRDGCNGSLTKGLDLDLCDYDYRFGLSTAAGIFLLYVILSMTLDVGIRAIKLGILQIFAPIPISSYIVSKDKLNNFVKLAVNVYIDLFIRLIVIYFIIYFVSEIINNMGNSVTVGDGYAATPFETSFVKIAIIIALFMFAKNAPKFISDILGLKGDGFGDMKDMFKPAWQRAGALGAAGGMLTAATGNAINKAKFMDWKGQSVGQKLKNAAKVAGSGVAGAASAGFHGGLAAMQGKDTKEVNAAGYKRAIRARQNRDLDKLNGVTPMDRARVRMGDMLGIDTKASLAENKQKAYSTLHSDVGAYKKAVMGRIDKNPSIAMRGEASYNSAIHQLGQMLVENERIINSGTNKDLQNILNKFTTVTDSRGRTVYTLKSGEHIGYYDLEAVRVNAEQEHIGSISGKIEPLKTIAQKEIFSDAMAGNVVDVNGVLMDEVNFGDAGYRARGITKEKSAHSDITTAVQTAMQHITENGVPLGEDPEFLKRWFQGKATREDVEKFAPGDPDMQNRILKGDFGGLDDLYQRRSEALSEEMSGSSEHLARASLERRNANKDKK